MASVTPSNTSCAPKALARSVALRSDMGSRGRLYLPGAACPAGQGSTPRARWAIIAATFARPLRNVGSRIVKLPLPDGRRGRPGLRRMARLDPAAQHHVAHRRAALAVLLPVDTGSDRHRPALRLGAAPPLRSHSGVGARPAAPLAAGRPAGRGPRGA